jgi:hypothetical protein
MQDHLTHRDYMTVSCHFATACTLLAGAAMPPDLDQSSRWRTTFMSAIRCGLGWVATSFMLIGLIPFLGWLNWLTSLPLAIAAAVAFYLELREPPRGEFSQVGFLLSDTILCFVVFRLVLGGGLV